MSDVSHGDTTYPTHYDHHTSSEMTTGTGYSHDYDWYQNVHGNTHAPEYTSSYIDGPHANADHVHYHDGDYYRATTYVNKNDPNMVTGSNTHLNEEIYGQQLQYHEDRLEYDLDTNDTTHSTSRRYIQRIYDPTSNTYCHTKIEQYYTTTYTE